MNTVQSIIRLSYIGLAATPLFFPLSEPFRSYCMIFLVGITYYQLMALLFPFRAAKSYEQNLHIYEWKKSITGLVCNISISVFIAALGGFIAYCDSHAIMGSVIKPIFIALILFWPFTIAGDLLESQWRNFHFAQYGVVVQGEVVKCTPTHVKTQDDTYKSTGLGNFTQVKIRFDHEGKQYFYTCVNQPNKIYYTYEPNDPVELTISTANPSFVQLNRYLFDRPIDMERYKMDNFGTYKEPESSGCGCGCG